MRAQIGRVPIADFLPHRWEAGLTPSIQNAIALAGSQRRMLRYQAIDQCLAAVAGLVFPAKQTTTKQSFIECFDI